MTTTEPLECAAFIFCNSMRCKGHSDKKVLPSHEEDEKSAETHRFTGALQDLFFHRLQADVLHNRVRKQRMETGHSSVGECKR